MIGVAVLAVAFVAHGDERWSVLGYVRVSGERGKLTLTRFDFEDMYGAPDGSTVADLIGEQVPPNSLVYLWNRSAANYTVVSRLSRGGWSGGGTNRVARGEGFWIRVPADAPSNHYPVYLFGAVPDRYTAPTTTIAGLSGQNLLGYPYPVPMKWTNTDLAKKVGDSALIYLWDQTNQIYEIYSKSTRSGWSAAGNVVMNPGQGFWLRDTNIVNWVEVKPYSWP